MQRSSGINVTKKISFHNIVVIANIMKGDFLWQQFWFITMILTEWNDI